MFLNSNPNQSTVPGGTINIEIRNREVPKWFYSKVEMELKWSPKNESTVGSSNCKIEPKIVLPQNFDIKFLKIQNIFNQKISWIKLTNKFWLLKSLLGPWFLLHQNWGLHLLRPTNCWNLWMTFEFLWDKNQFQIQFFPENNHQGFWN